MIILYLAAGLSLVTVIYRIIKTELWIRRLPEPGPRLPREGHDNCLRKVEREMLRKSVNE